MLIDVAELFPSPMKRSSLTTTHEDIRNLIVMFKKYPWFKRLYMDVNTTKQNAFVVESKEPIDVDVLPDMYGGYQLRYIWSGRKKLSIEDAAKKFWCRYHREPWFSDVKVVNNKYIDVTLKNIKHKLWNFYEDYPIQFGLEVKKDD